MTTELTQVSSLKAIESGLAAFEQRRANLSELASSAKALSLGDWNDRQALKTIADKRKELKAERVQLQKEGKSMRDLITPIARHISAKEKELVDIISPEEDRLQDIELWAESEAEKARQAVIEAENKRIQARIDSLAELGYQIDYSDVKGMSDETFAKYLEAAKSQHEKELAQKAEADRIQKEKEAQERIEREAELKRIAEERAELERLRQRQAAAQRIIDEENARIEKEKKAIEEERLRTELAKKREEEEKERAERIRLAQVEAAEAARLKEIEAERLKRESEERQRLAAERKAARQPDKIKIQKYIADVKAVAIPALNTSEGNEVMRLLQELISRFDSYASEKADTL